MSDSKSPENSITTLISKLENVKRSGAGWEASCPAHDDEHPSLSIAEGQNGKILVHCHAGCSQELVIAALKRLDAWPTKTKQSKTKRRKMQTERKGSTKKKLLAKHLTLKQFASDSAFWENVLEVRLDLMHPSGYLIKGQRPIRLVK